MIQSVSTTRYLDHCLFLYF